VTTAPDVVLEAPIRVVGDDPIEDRGPDAVQVPPARRARAYCGPAHGRSWPLVSQGPPPRLVDVELGDEVVRYRLVHHPRTRRPVRDHLGTFVYMPVRRLSAG